MGNYLNDYPSSFRFFDVEDEVAQLKEVVEQQGHKIIVLESTVLAVVEELRKMKETT